MCCGALLVQGGTVGCESEASEQIAAALDAGQADGMSLRVQPVDGERFRLILVSATTGTEPATVPLGLPGFPEPR